jgi:hypothetical protein
MQSIICGDHSVTVTILFSTIIVTKSSIWPEKGTVVPIFPIENCERLLKGFIGLLL